MSGTERKTFNLERTFRASPERVWTMLTTREGLERWWSPEGFRSVVRHLDLRVGGGFEIEMTAEQPEIVAYLKSLGLSPSNVVRGQYGEVVTARRLAYANLLDFIPGVAPYTTRTVIALSAAAGGGTRMVVTNDVLHDATFTQNARTGWEQQLGKLEKSLAQPGQP